MKLASVKESSRKFHAGVARGMKLAALEARKVARQHGTPIYVWRKGKVVALKP